MYRHESSRLLLGDAAGFQSDYGSSQRSARTYTNVRQWLGSDKMFNLRYKNAARVDTQTMVGREKLAASLQPVARLANPLSMTVFGVSSTNTGKKACTMLAESLATHTISL